jgi:proteasome activator subunit 4
MAGSERVAELSAPVEISRASTPGVPWGNSTAQTAEDVSKLARTRPRTFAYFRYLPYPTEDQAERECNLDECIRNLYVAVAAGDFAPGAVHWTREIRGWLSLKFDLPRETRVKLVKLYYELALVRTKHDAFGIFNFMPWRSSAGSYHNGSTDREDDETCL